MAQGFYTLEEMAPRFGVDADMFIRAWLDDKLPLYIYLGSDSPSCTLRRCIPRQLHEYARDNILYGRDSYQSKDSPDHDTLIFIPEHPLSAHLKVKARYELGEGAGPGLGAYYEYRYRGSARGYWLAMPTMTAHLSRGKYLLTDKEAVGSKSSPVGDVMVHAYDEYDFLIFPETIYINKLSFFVKESEVKNKFSELTETIIQSNSFAEGEKILSQSHRPPNINFALYLMISEWWPSDKNGNKIIIKSKLRTYLNDHCGLKTSIKTIGRWAEKPELENNIIKREREGRKNALYYILKIYCEEKNIEMIPPVIVEKLNKLARDYGYGPEVSFDTIEVTVWLQEPNTQEASENKNH